MNKLFLPLILFSLMGPVGDVTATAVVSPIETAAATEIPTSTATLALPTDTATTEPTATDTPTPQPTVTPEPTATPQPTPTPTPVDFGPFNSQAIPLEFQAWWEPCCGHVHAAARLPIKGTWSGTVIVPVRVVMHNHRGTLDVVSVGTESGGGTETRAGMPLTCVTDICAFNFDIPVNTRLMKDGWREIRVKARTTSPDGKDFYNSSGTSIYIDNGTTDSNVARGCNNTASIARAWYDGPGYTNVIIECAPLMPQSGIVTFGFRAAEPSQRLVADIDKTHYIPAVGSWPEQIANAGINIFDKLGNFQTFQRVQVDTITLANGWHSLQVRSESPDGLVSVCSTCPVGVISRSSAVSKIWFFVQN